MNNFEKAKEIHDLQNAIEAERSMWGQIEGYGVCLHTSFAGQVHISMWTGSVGRSDTISFFVDENGVPEAANAEPHSFTDEEVKKMSKVLQTYLEGD